MTDKGAFADRKRTVEEEYFRKQELELIERMRQRTAQENERQELAATLGVTDAEILNTLQEMGYARATVSLLYLVPLVQVAWAEGSVSKSERELILEAARLRGIEAGSAAYEQLIGWLNEQPSEELFERTLRVISALLQALPPEQREASKRDLVAFCTQVAGISGGLAGFLSFGGKVCKEERELLERIAAQLERSHEAAAKQAVGGDQTSDENSPRLINHES